MWTDYLGDVGKTQKEIDKMAKVIYDVKMSKYDKLYVFDIQQFDGSDDEVKDFINSKVKDYDNFKRVIDIDYDNHVVRIDQIPVKPEIKKVYIGQFNDMLSQIQQN